MTDRQLIKSLRQLIWDKEDLSLFTKLKIQLFLGLPWVKEPVLDCCKTLVTESGYQADGEILKLLLENLDKIIAAILALIEALS